MQTYKERREILTNRLGKGLFIIETDPERFINDDNEYLYRPGTDFFYYTGFPEPESAMVLESTDKLKYTLFVRPKDKKKEVWTGRRCGVSGAMEEYGADVAFPISLLNTTITNLIEHYIVNGLKVYYHTPKRGSLIDKLIEPYKFLVNSVVDPNEFTKIMDQQRVIKTESEIEIMRRSARISAEAMKDAMVKTRTNAFEYQVEADIVNFHNRRGVRSMAYGTIAGSGNNATTLHYWENNSELKDGDLILVDAGGEYEHYAADITRTWPINGKFTESQKEIYELVLRTQLECIKRTKPGITIMELNDLSRQIITEGLIDLGLLEGTVEDNIKDETYKKYYMHSIGHWLGMDVHDCGTVSRKDTKLVPGHVFTIEPGIYINEEEDVPERYKGIGVRIEDDILVTEDGCEVLSEYVPKTVEEIMNLME